MNSCCIRSKWIKQDERSKRFVWVIVLFAAMLLFKFALEFGFVKIVSLNTRQYRLDFDPIKYVNGLIWCAILFMGIQHRQRKVSTFMLYLMLVMQIIPITVIYAFSDGNAMYYNILCLGFLLCEVMAQRIQLPGRIRRYRVITVLGIAAFIGLASILLLIVIRDNGVPSTTALDISAVYDLRSSGSFKISKYMSYVLNWCMTCIFPFLLALALQKKKYISSAAVAGCMMLLYLYSGHKIFMFSIAVVVVLTLWGRRKNCYKELFLLGCTGFALLVVLAYHSPIGQEFFAEVFSLFGRRTMLVSANLKFVYHDFFSNNPYLGFAGIFPRWLIDIPNPYAELEVSLPQYISSIYFDLPEMWANTGFFAEAFYRFGYGGVLCWMTVLGVVLQLMDSSQEWIGYPALLGCGGYLVYSLADGGFIGDLLFIDRWMIFVLILLLFNTSKVLNRERITGMSVNFRKYSN